MSDEVSISKDDAEALYRLVNGMSLPLVMGPWRDGLLARLRAAIDEPSPPTPTTRHGWTAYQAVECVECPTCAFTFAAYHENTDGAGYSCPECGPREEPRP